RGKVHGRQTASNAPPRGIEVGREVDEDAAARPFQIARDVALTGRVVGQENVARAQAALAAITALDLDQPAEHDDELSSRCGVEVHLPADGRLTEDDAGRGNGLRELRVT